MARKPKHPLKELKPYDWRTNPEHRPLEQKPGPKIEGLPRRNRITVVLTDDEERDAWKLAKSKQMTLSTWVRGLILAAISEDKSNDA